MQSITWIQGLTCFWGQHNGFPLKWSLFKILILEIYFMVQNCSWDHPAGDVSRVLEVPGKVTVKIRDAENWWRGCRDKYQLKKGKKYCVILSRPLSLESEIRTIKCNKKNVRSVLFFTVTYPGTTKTWVTSPAGWRYVQTTDHSLTCSKMFCCLLLLKRNLCYCSSVLFVISV